MSKKLKPALLYPEHCRRCGHRWYPRVVLPRRCPFCGSYKWREKPDADKASDRPRPKKRS